MLLAFYYLYRFQNFSKQIRQLAVETESLFETDGAGTIQYLFTDIRIYVCTITDALHRSTVYITVCRPPPLPLRISKAGRNHFLNEELPPPPLWDRRLIQPNHIKFRTCSALAPMGTPPINESDEPTQQPLVNLFSEIYAGCVPCWSSCRGLIKCTQIETRLLRRAPTLLCR